MKIINRSSSTKKIQWSKKDISIDNVTETVLRFKKLVLNQGTSAFDQINKELNSKSPKSFKVKKSEISKSDSLVSNKLKQSILNSAANIKTICENDKKGFIGTPVETTKGIKIWKEFRPIDSVGIYVPGGSAPLISSLLMQLIPATVAGCKNIIICTPPNQNGLVAPEILWIAKLYGVKNIYKVGGAQAIFAMAYGTTIIPKVNKIFGPGNSYVNEAKKLCSNDVAIDLPAGPSEVMIVTNDLDKISIAAADALSQLEHDPNSKAFIISNNLTLLKKIKGEISKQMSNLTRQNVLSQSIKNVLLIKAKSFKDSISLINECAPEHLILLDNDYSKYLIQINNAGSIFCGALSPESFGDYSSGSNHVLPTNGQAKVHSGLSVNDFGKHISVQTASAEGFNNLKDTVIEMARAETLDGHQQAVKIREDIASKKAVSRSYSEIRKTNETNIYINLNLDGSGNYNIQTGLNYLDHLLEQFSKHGSIDLNLSCLGDLEIDEHHTIEDIAIALGTAINNALGDRIGIARYASSEILVMDEVKSIVSIDLSSRRYLNFKCSKLRDYVGDFPTEMFEHFFISLINSIAMTCHIETTGKNSHHLLEATFKTFARCLRSAVVIESTSSSSTKGIL
ncbi:histidinol dehydrogenase [Gammaproteobacteria bacterium]|nr:histidinol dehydrogenase [Gammaproteobacteria bacterium]